MNILARKNELATKGELDLDEIGTKLNGRRYAVVKENQNRMAVSASIIPIWIMVIFMTICLTFLAMYSLTVSWISNGRTGVIKASRIANTTER